MSALEEGAAQLNVGLLRLKKGCRNVLLTLKKLPVYNQNICQESI